MINLFKTQFILFFLAHPFAPRPLDTIEFNSVFDFVTFIKSEYLCNIIEKNVDLKVDLIRAFSTLWEEHMGHDPGFDSQYHIMTVMNKVCTALPVLSKFVLAFYLRKHMHAYRYPKQIYEVFSYVNKDNDNWLPITPEVLRRIKSEFVKTIASSKEMEMMLKKYYLYEKP
jgi:hypothetical protein